MNDDETMAEWLRRQASDKEFSLKKETRISIDIINDVKYEDKQFFEHLMSDPLDLTFTITFGDLIFENCSVIISKDGKRMEWFNDETSGVIEVK